MESLNNRGDNASARQVKPSVPGEDCISLSQQPKGSSGMLQICRLMPWLLGTCYTVMVRPNCSGPHLCHLTGRSGTGAYLDASFLIISIHVRGYSAWYQRRKVVINITQIQTLRLIIVPGLPAVLM